MCTYFAFFFSVFILLEVPPLIFLGPPWPEILATPQPLVILFTGMPYNPLVIYKSILQIDIVVPEVLFLEFVAGKKNIFLYAWL
jgi:hypothetical protein